MSGFDLKDINEKNAKRVQPNESKEIELDGQKVQATLAPLSWNMIRIAIAD